MRKKGGVRRLFFPTLIEKGSSFSNSNRKTNLEQKSEYRMTRRLRKGKQKWITEKKNAKTIFFIPKRNTQTSIYWVFTWLFLTTTNSSSSDKRRKLLYRDMRPPTIPIRAGACVMMADETRAICPTALHTCEMWLRASNRRAKKPGLSYPTALIERSLTTGIKQRRSTQWYHCIRHINRRNTWWWWQYNRRYPIGRVNPSWWWCGSCSRKQWLAWSWFHLQFQLTKVM